MSEETEVTFYAVAPVSDLKPGERLFLEINHEPVVVFRVGDQFYAIGDICTHDHGPLGDGDLIGYEVICPRHGARFDIRTGKATRLPAIKPTPWYPARVHDGMIEIGIAKE
ncbi:MAG: non-heme iron oxygenase ferredoxin subunit [Anaerolineaceae bacterium]